MKQKKSVEDYLKTIYILSRKKDVHGADIAKAIGVSRPTVCVSLKALEEEGYILMDSAREVHLTKKGMQIAEETYERHNMFCQLLTELGVDEKVAASDACEMEHAVSDESYQALKALVAERNGEQRPPSFVWRGIGLCGCDYHGDCTDILTKAGVNHYDDQ